MVVMLHEWGKDLDGTEHAPTLLSEGLSTLAYARMAPTLWMLAEFIRGLGYNAIPAANDTALSIPLAVDAGLGQMGRHGLLINPKVGARCRISKIFTDLPLEPAGAVDSGITEFCNACLKCVPKCGTKAITTGDRSFEPLAESNSAGVLSWKVDATKCMTFQNRVGSTCSTCVRRCAWTKPPRKVYAIPRFFIRNFRWKWLNRSWVWLDDLAGNGKFDKKSDDFWWGAGKRSNRPWKVFFQSVQQQAIGLPPGNMAPGQSACMLAGQLFHRATGFSLRRFSRCPRAAAWRIRWPPGRNRSSGETQVADPCVARAGQQCAGEPRAEHSAQEVGHTDNAGSSGFGFS